MDNVFVVIHNIKFVGGGTRGSSIDILLGALLITTEHKEK